MHTPLKLTAVVLDWAGTIVDFGSYGPVGAMLELFQHVGLEITPAEARAPMGMAKMDHIKTLAAMPAVTQQWRRIHGRPFTEADAIQLYDIFTRLNTAVISKFCDLIPGALTTVNGLRQRGLRIGSTTGYNRSIMDVLAPLAASRGYVPDNLVCAGDLAAARPTPLMMYRTFADLGVWPPRTVIKVDDTTVGIQEGLNAGTWTVGVAISGNAAALSLSEWLALEPARQETVRQTATDTLRRAGAHYVVDSVADLPKVIDAIETRVGQGERPEPLN